MPNLSHALLHSLTHSAVYFRTFTETRRVAMVEFTRFPNETIYFEMKRKSKQKNPNGLDGKWISQQ